MFKFFLIWIVIGIVLQLINGFIVAEVFDKAERKSGVKDVEGEQDRYAFSGMIEYVVCVNPFVHTPWQDTTLGFIADAILGNLFTTIAWPVTVPLMIMGEAKWYRMYLMHLDWVKSIRQQET